MTGSLCLDLFRISISFPVISVSAPCYASPAALKIGGEGYLWYRLSFVKRVGKIKGYIVKKEWLADCAAVFSPSLLFSTRPTLTTASVFAGRLICGIAVIKVQGKKLILCVI